MTKLRKEILEPKIEPQGDFLLQLNFKPRRQKDSILSTLSRARKASKIFSKPHAAKGRGRVTRQNSNFQSVIVKASVVKSKAGQGARKLKAHVNYLARAGVGRSGEEITFTLNSENLSAKELKKALTNWNEDPHHFRFIISPERASELDLDNYVKSLVERINKDLNTKLEWFSVAHYNTDNPHVHLIVRGVDEDRKALYINRDYIKHGLRHAAQLEATVRLGKEPKHLKLSKIIQRTKELKLTAIDKRLLDKKHQSNSDTFNLITPSKGSSELSKIYFEAEIKRLHFLRDLGLAEELNPGAWKLKDNLEKTLYALGRKQEVEKKLGNKLEHSQHLFVHDEKLRLERSYKGIVLDRGLDEELNEKVYILVSGEDGANHYQVLSKFSEAERQPLSSGQVVEVSPKSSNSKTDKTILRFINNNIFDLPNFTNYIHKQRELGNWKIPINLSTEDYVDRYRERLANLSNSGIIKQGTESKYEIPSDLGNQVQRLESSLGVKQHIEVKILSSHTLEEQIKLESKTWLDELLVNKSIKLDSRTSFGKKVSEAILNRKEVLKLRGYSIAPGLLEQLVKDEQSKLIKTLSPKYGQYVSAQNLGSQSWTIAEYKKLSDASYAVVTNSSKFALYKLKVSEEVKLPLGSTISLPSKIRRAR